MTTKSSRAAALLVLAAVAILTLSRECESPPPQRAHTPPAKLTPAAPSDAPAGSAEVSAEPPAADTDTPEAWRVTSRVLRRDPARAEDPIAPAAGVEVRLAALLAGFGGADPEGEARAASTDEAGRFAFDDVPGGLWYRLTIDDASSALVVLQFELPDAERRRADLGDILLESATSLLVELVGPRDEPIDDGTVEARSARGAQATGGERRVYAGAIEAEPLSDGAYLFERLPVASVHVSALAPGYTCALLHESIARTVELPRDAPLVLRLRDGPAVAGVVVDEAGAPVAGARVEISAPGGCWPPPLRTDAAGRFVFDSLYDDEEAYRLSIRAEGFAPLDRFDVELDRLDHVVTLTRGATISGRVLGVEDGRPIAGAVVGLAGLSRKHERRTDGRGRFELRELPAGALVLDARHDAFVPSLADAPVHIAAGERSDGHTIRLERGATTRVAVVDASSGNPVPNAAVTLSLAKREGELAIERSGSTGADGHLTWRGLRAGSGRLEARAAGYLASGERPVAIEPSDASELVVALEPAVTASGRVLDSDGRAVPLARVAVVLDDTDSPERERVELLVSVLAASADAWGRYRIDGIPAHEGLRLVASRDDFAPAVSSALAAAAGEHLTNIDLVLSRGATVRGGVFDEHGAALAVATVEAQRMEGGATDADAVTRHAPSSRAVATDARGRYAIGALVPGRYTITARASGRVGPPERAVELAAAQTLDGIDFRFARGEVLRGRLVGSDGAPLPRWWVCLEDAPLETWTDAEGRFELSGLEPGRTRGFFAKKKYYSGTWGYEAWFEVALPADELVLTLRSKATISGRVGSRAGRPSSGEVEVTPIWSDTGRPLTSTTAGVDAAGRFRVEVYPGRYRLRAITLPSFPAFEPEPGEAPVVAGPASAAPSQLEVEVAEGETRDGVELAFDDE